MISPDALGDAAADPARMDRLSARYLIAVGARIVREVGRLAERGEVATLTIDAELKLTNRKAFAEELTQLVTELAARHHDDAGRAVPPARRVAPDPQEDDHMKFEVEVPGTPEQVWEAIATGPGISAWFMPADVDRRQVTHPLRRRT